MLTQKQLNDFADLVVKIGVNLKQNQDLIVNCPIECAFFARIIAKNAYQAGARSVSVNWKDDDISRIVMENTDVEVLEQVPRWSIEQKTGYVKDKVAVINIAASDPSLYEGIDTAKIKRASNASSKAFKTYVDATMSNGIRWCIVSVPTEKWAQKIFAGCDAKTAVDKL